KIHGQWSSLQIKAVHVKQQLTPYLADQIADFRLRLADLEQWQDEFRSSFIGYGLFHQNVPEHYERIDTLNETIDSKLKEVSDLRETSAVFDMAIPEFKQLNQCKEELYAVKQLWDIIDIITSSMAYWRTTTWKDANIEMIEQTLKQKFLLKELRGLSKACGKWDNFIRIESEVKNMLSAIRVISELKTDSMRDRHWNELMESTTGFFFKIDDSMKLDDLLRLNLHAYEDQVRDIVEKSIKELSMEKTLNDIFAVWKSATFDVVEHERTVTSLLVARDDIIESLDEHQNQLQMMATSKYADYFANDPQYWQTQLAAVDQVLRKLIDVQKTWSYLETIFIGTQDIRAKLPKKTRQFHIQDSDFKNICKSNMEDLNIVGCMNRPGLLDLFESIERRLSQSQKALEGYLETKRIMFPRFYFVSPSELLDILSNGTDPSKVMHLLIKLFDSIDKLELEPVNLSSEDEKPSSKKTRKSSTKSGHSSRNSGQLRHKRKHHHSTSSRRRDKHHKQAKSANKFATYDSVRDQQKKSVLINEADDNDEPEGAYDDEDTEDVSEKDDFTMMMNEVTTEDPISAFATGMYSDEGEFVKFMDKYLLEGQVGYWINTVLQAMKNSIRHWLKEAVSNYEHQNREAWIGKYPAQIVLTGSQIWWASEFNAVFQSIETNTNALKDYLKKQMNQLNALKKLLLGDLNELDRQKITTLCRIDLHARDIVEKMINAKIDNAGDFMWQSQLRLRWSDQQNHCFAKLCDANFLYQYEYLGNKSKLVITPLIDRCYITLTQSLHLYMCGAPAGPAGTGKTETTKDLRRTLGVKVVVSNRSEHMDYSSLGNLFKCLAQSGLCGCFDEFNRITADVLSVVSIQVKTILYALRSRKERFDFMGADIALNSSVGIFITMNPGYAGRTEQPESMKALFRPCAMIVPDFDLITELNLVSVGFTEAKVLSRKFVTLYSLCRDLLFKQDHYDWGLRAIKSVLVVAGNLRRADPDLPENMVLTRALRDFNVPKITNDNLSIFLGLIQDLAPALDVPRKQDANLEKYIKQAAMVQLKELLEVQHSVFIVGESGSGKSCFWKTLQHAYRLMSQRPIAVDLNPKAVKNDELFGVVNKTTIEWRDGLLSSTMRQLASMKHSGPKWIVLDRDIDPMWIESLNTVMNDNKLLTLASNERIPLTKTMRMLFEIYHLRTATPATVSCADIKYRKISLNIKNPFLEILYINSIDIGYVPLFQSWLEKRQNSSERTIIQLLFDKYVLVTFECLREKCRKAIPIVDVSHGHSLCILLNCLLTIDRIPPCSTKEWYQVNFEFAWIWASAGCLIHDQYGDHRNVVSKWWITEFKQPSCSVEGTNIFDYFPDPSTQTYELWKTIVPEFIFESSIPLSSQFVPTSENRRIVFWIMQLIKRAHPVMIAGAAGTGKTLLRKKCLSYLNGENYSVTNISLNYATDCEMLQCLLERKLARKAGKTFAPPVDQYQTVLAHTILRQHLDYGQWYDRRMLSLKEIKNCQYVVCMNQNAGNFFISPRLQRHFITFAMSFPSKEALQTTLASILYGHMTSRKEAEYQFSSDMKAFIPAFVEGTIAIHYRIASLFLPTAIKFYYLFNLRDIQRIYEGIIFANNECMLNPESLIRLYTHEAYKTYSDKMLDKDDVLAMDKLLKDLIYKDLKPKDVNKVFDQPLIYSHYASGQAMPTYLPVKDMVYLQTFATQMLKNYNDVNNPPMELVMFEDALIHICRINRILETPNGNALLISVGGSGKQSIARLAAFMSSIDTFKADLRKFASSIGISSAFKQYLPENWIKINDGYVIGYCGDVYNMFSEEETYEIVNSLKTEMKVSGMEIDRNSAWVYFISKVKIDLKVVLTFSPVGNAIRKKARCFPALVTATTIDWFQKWPKEALISVAENTLQHSNHVNQAYASRIARFMSEAHEYVEGISKSFIVNTSRYYYTTPKTFLEFISLYVNLSAGKVRQINEDILRLRSGLNKDIIVNARTETADAVLKIVTAETDKVVEHKSAAEAKNAKLEIIKNDVQRNQAACAEDLEKVKPALLQADAALETLSKENLSELKSFNSPPDMVRKVMEFVIVLLAGKSGKVPEDRSWKAAKLTIDQVTDFLKTLQNFDKDNIPISTVNLVEKLLKASNLDPALISKKSVAASGLCLWIVNIVKYHDLYQDILPKKLALDETDVKLTEAKQAYDEMMKKVKDRESKLEEKNQEMRIRLAEKDEAVKNKLETAKSIELANRLVLSLGSGKVIWEKRTRQLQQYHETTIGDMLLTSALLTYMGYFSMPYRDAILERWVTLLKSEEEMPALEKSKYETTMTINQNKITLKKLESSLLTMLANAEGNFIQNIELVETLETNVNTAKEIELKTHETTVFYEEIDKSREVYRPTAVRGRIIFFIMDSLYKIHPMYKFNLKAFKMVFVRGVENANVNDNVQQRVSNIVSSIPLSLFRYTAPGLFEDHKLIFTTQISLQTAVVDKEIKDDHELDFLLKFATEDQKSPVLFLDNRTYGAVKTLSKLRYFSGLDIDVESNSRKWKTFIESELPQTIRLHGEWNNLNDIQRLCIVRALRPDRMVYALRLFITHKLGKEFIKSSSKDMATIISEFSKSTPVFFILSPGVDPVNELEMFAGNLGYSFENGNLGNVSLGQGQEVVAENVLQASAKNGHWVILQNIHLVPARLPLLEKYIEQFSERTAKQFRLFLTGEPVPDELMHVIPQGILEVSLKISNEPPTGMSANLHKALDNITQEQLDSSNKEFEYRTIMFALCYFHATITQRIKFGAIGWNRSYPFGSGDLSICSTILLNYLEVNNKVPWPDLRYLFGEIMYGGHITDDWDRRSCKCYLDTYLTQQLIDSELWLAPGFQVPAGSLDLEGYHEYVVNSLPEESPRLYGLHSNAELEFLSNTSERVFKKVLELQPREASIDNIVLDAINVDKDEEIKTTIDDILTNLPEEFSMSDIMLKMSNTNPYTVVASQEWERINILIAEIRRSLNELSAGLKGELSISSQMEDLQQSLYVNVVPQNWANKAYPSQYSLAIWVIDMTERQKELNMWISRFAVLDSVWIGGLFNPQSFFTALMQTTARRNDWSLDKMSISVEVTSKKSKLDGVQFLPKDAIQIHGVFLDEASWDRVQGRLTNAIPMELSHEMPPMLLRAIQADRSDSQNHYDCPMYKTIRRGSTYVWKFNLKTKEPATKWILAGVAMLLQN
ncbi:hypothetical protein GJ496_010034, partial [Pomphorhynchus laevis]